MNRSHTARLQGGRSGLSGLLAILGIYAVALVLLLVGRCISDEFWKTEKLLQVVKDVSILGIVALGLSLVTCCGRYVDLSIPAMMAVSGIVSVILLPGGFVVALAGGLAAGTLIGLVNGIVVGCFRLNPIIWTLAVMSLADGITRWAYGGTWVYVDEGTAPGRLFAGLYRAEIGGAVPLAVLLFVAAAAATYFLRSHTGFGKKVKLTGASSAAARLSGIATGRVIATAFAISGFAAAIGGIIKTSFNMYGDVESGLTYDFQAITAVVIGGTALSGGRGSTIGVVGGVLVIGLLGHVMPLLPGIGQDEQFLIRGGIFIAVVGLSSWFLRRGGSDSE